MGRNSFALALISAFFTTTVAAHDGGWRSKYTTGRDFEACCGVNDCHTAEELGNPAIVNRGDGGYRVQVNGHWLEYDHPAVHVSHDWHTWICYLESKAEPDPLCLFLPPAII